MLKLSNKLKNMPKKSQTDLINYFMVNVWESPEEMKYLKKVK